MDTGLLPPHHLLRGRYRIVALVGQGERAAVYQAEDTALGNRLVAVKEMRQGGLSPEELAVAAEQFRSKASLLAGLRHPNLPHLDEQFQEAGRRYLVLEFIEGEPLETYLQRAPGGRLPVEAVLQLGIQLASVLAYLHTRQPPIIFHNLTPATILRTSTGHLVLSDFGMARLSVPGPAKETLPVGSPGYAAPEQLGNTQTDGRSDIYSLGAVLHQALSGHDPATNTLRWWDFPPLQITDPAGLESLIFQMVQPTMQERPASMTEVKWRLQALAEELAARHQGRVVPGPGRPAAPPTVQVQPVAGVLPPPSRPAASRRGKLIAASLSGMVAAIMVLAVLLIPKWAGGTSLLGEKTLCIASEFPTSGPDGDVGQPAENGVTLAVAEQSALGSGYTLEVRNFNDVSPTTGIHDPGQGAQNVQQMLQDPCIVGMVGPFNSGVAAAEMPIAAYGDLTMISPSNTNPGLTLPQYAQQYGFDYEALHPAGKPNVYFRLTANDVVQGQFDADFTVDGLAARSAYVIDDTGTYGKHLADFFTQEFQRQGGHILGRAEMASTRSDLWPRLSSQIVATHPQVVFYGGVTSGGGGYLRAQLAQAGFHGPLVGGDGIADDNVFLTQAANAAENTYGTVAAPDLSTFTSATQEQFISAYQARFNASPGTFSAFAYDAANILITAISDLIAVHKAVTRDAVRAAVQPIQYSGLTGHLSFDQHGDNSGQRVLSIYAVKNGQWMFLKQVTV